MSLKNDDASVLADPQWIPTHLRPDKRQVQFAWVPRDSHAKLAFLADEYLREIAPPSVWLGTDRVESAVCPAPAHYVFHSAFCCSTLIASALDLPGVAMGLKEPQILNELADLHRARSLTGELLSSVTGLLARPFGLGESVIIKPSNEANILAEPLLRQDGRTRAILLYSPLPKFLRSIARKGMWGRIWSRRLHALLRRDRGPDFGFSHAELFQQTDLQIAATAWLFHHHHFAALAAIFPAQVRMLDSETFLSNRENSLTQIGDHFGLKLDPSGWARIAQGDVFKKHSKEIGRDFTAGKQADALPNSIVEEVEMVCTWAQSLANHISMSLEPPPSLRISPSAAPVRTA